MAAGGHLPVYPRVVTGDVLADVPVDLPHHVVEPFRSVVECSVWLPVQRRPQPVLGVADEEALEAPPVVVEPLCKLVQRVGVTEEMPHLRAASDYVLPGLH